MQVAVMVLGIFLILLGIIFGLLPVLIKSNLPFFREVNLEKVPFVGKVELPAPILILFVGVGLFLFPVSPWWPLEAGSPTNGPDCSRASHPEFETDLRGHILDGLRQHYSYDGEYIVRSITKVGDWAYVEAAPEDTGVESAYLLKSDGLRWNWRWEGDIGAQPEQTGLPAGLTQSLRAQLLLCDT
jgi:hypothetical protein